MPEIPATLEKIYSPTQWLDLIFKSDLDDRLKLTGAVLASTATFSARDITAYSTLSDYVLSRLLKCNSAEASDYRAELVRLGWLHPTRETKVFILTFSKFPVEMRK